MVWISVAVHFSCKIVSIINYACIKKINTISFLTLTLNYPFLNNGPILNNYFLIHFITVIFDIYYTLKDGKRIQINENVSLKFVHYNNTHLQN